MNNGPSGPSELQVQFYQERAGKSLVEASIVVTVWPVGKLIIW
jgi:hypothetical protein